MRAADILIKALSIGGVRRIFTLSGNQIMPVFDACVGEEIELIHVRHEAATVHMADAWGRLTDEPGVALVTAGPGFANTLSALYVAAESESPLVLLSGHAPLGRLGQGVFQEMAQAEMASHVTKASWTAKDPSELGHDLARALRIARSGRPGPVHIALPVDVLESTVEDVESSLPRPVEFERETSPADDSIAAGILDVLAEASRPLLITGPAAMRGEVGEVLSSLARQTRVPVVPMESPRGVNDPALGALAELLPEADLIVLLGKKLDGGLRFGEPPEINPGCKFVQVDPETEALEQTERGLDGSRLVAKGLGDTLAMAKRLEKLAAERVWPGNGWYEDVQSAVSYRPAAWETLESPAGGPLHAVEVCRAIQELLGRDGDGVFVADGGEFGQWAQAGISAPRRIINGPSGAIGSGIPFALAAKLAFPNSNVVAAVGDGTFGFLPAEFDTAVRHGIPFILVVGNDAAWNAEYQIQIRDYGPDRVIGCELLPARYDLVASALGGHGENVGTPDELKPALDRALASGLPACVNVAIGRNPAPVIRRSPS